MLQACCTPHVDVCFTQLASGLAPRTHEHLLPKRMTHTTGGAWTCDRPPRQPAVRQALRSQRSVVVAHHVEQAPINTRQHTIESAS